MPRDASETRSRLLREAERLFARRGVYQAAVGDIVKAAGQRNTSALSYHFGSRDRVLYEILLRHGEPIDIERGKLLVEPIEGMSTRALVGSLLVPYGALLDSPSGRDYLRIVAQLTEQFPVWRAGATELTPPHLHRILTTLEDRVPSADPRVRRQRVLGVIMLLTAATADRARRLEEGQLNELDHDSFLATLADMLVGCLESPQGDTLVP